MQGFSVTESRASILNTPAIITVCLVKNATTGEKATMPCLFTAQCLEFTDGLEGGDFYTPHWLSNQTAAKPIQSTVTILIGDKN